jgi:nicotinamide-nucleotide amidase
MCAILAIGDELTTGQKVDTNSAWLSARLLDRGIGTVEHATVPDEPEAIGAAIRRLARAADIVIVTGGLGPTADDLTRQGLAIALDERDLVEDEGALADICRWFESSGRSMPEPNRVQALRPRSATWLPNNFGTAPGLRAQIAGGAVTFCLPGPPREMRPMFEASVLPELPQPDRAVVARFLHTFGAGESQVAEMLGDLMDRDRNPLVGTTASGGVVTCRLRAEFDSKDAAEAALDETEDQVREKLGDLIFGAGDDTLQSALIGLLRARSHTLATVESCTGGLLGALLTEIAGASDVYSGGWVTYTDEMKTAEVNVPREVLGRRGAVSREVACAMARGGRAASGADWALAITGVAGPGGGSKAKPVGTVWIGLAGPDEALDVRRFQFKGNRGDVREWSARSALGIVRLQLIGRPERTLLRQAE